MARVCAQQRGGQCWSSASDQSVLSSLRISARIVPRVRLPPPVTCPSLSPPSFLRPSSSSSCHVPRMAWHCAALRQQTSSQRPNERLVECASFARGSQHGQADRCCCATAAHCGTRRPSGMVGGRLCSLRCTMLLIRTCEDRSGKRGQNETDERRDHGWRQSQCEWSRGADCHRHGHRSGWRLAECAVRTERDELCLRLRPARRAINQVTPTPSPIRSADTRTHGCDSSGSSSSHACENTFECALRLQRQQSKSRTDAALDGGSCYRQ